MKKVTSLLLALLFVAFSLTGCGKYVSSYSAVAFAHSNERDSAWMSFLSFNGSQVFKLKCESDNEAAIQYSGKLESGSLSVYYDCGGEKKELFSLQAGDDILSTGGELPEDTVYIIVETSEKCGNGSLSFEIVYTEKLQ